MTAQLPPERVAELAEVLAGHVLYGDPDNSGGDFECSCGLAPPGDAWEEDFGEERWHRSHVSQALASLVARWVTEVRAEALADAFPLSLADTQRIVGHLIHDGTRDGLILSDLLNAAMGASARRRAALATGRDEGAGE